MKYIKLVYVGAAVVLLLGGVGVGFTKTNPLTFFTHKSGVEEKAQVASSLEDEGDGNNATVTASSSANINTSLSILHEKDDEERDENKHNDGGRIRASRTENDDSNEDVSDDDASSEQIFQGTSNTPSSTPPPSQQLSTYTTAQVALHNSQTSCWSIIDNAVYNLTAWVNQHPGGEQAILGLCGKDGSAAFHGQHGSNQKQANILVTMKIGVLSP